MDFTWLTPACLMGFHLFWRGRDSWSMVFLFCGHMHLVIHPQLPCVVRPHALPFCRQLKPVQGKRQKRSKRTKAQPPEQGVGVPKVLLLFIGVVFYTPGQATNQNKTFQPMAYYKMAVLCLKENTYITR